MIMVFQDTTLNEIKLLLVLIVINITNLTLQKWFGHFLNNIVNIVVGLLLGKADLSTMYAD